MVVCVGMGATVVPLRDGLTACNAIYGGARAPSLDMLALQMVFRRAGSLVYGHYSRVVEGWVDSLSHYVWRCAGSILGLLTR